MKLNFNKAQYFVMPAKFYQLINAELEQATHPESSFNTITLNFRDLDYSAELGGHHPIEVHLERHKLGWQLVYITDFSFQGQPFPELIKEIDICFVTKKVFSLFSGWLNSKSGIELINLFIDSFIKYHAMNAYQTSVSFD